ncbi:hypothetical protein EV126DRAFT_426542 [Verticillium dahliae]|nr:hypothetical protein EV126DRAFT_426542 [Verticillium dahliae]
MQIVERRRRQHFLLGLSLELCCSEAARPSHHSRHSRYKECTEHGKSQSRGANKVLGNFPVGQLYHVPRSGQSMNVTEGS